MGMKVACTPELPPLSVDTIPANLAAYARVGEALSAEEWDTIQAATLQRAGYRYTPSSKAHGLCCLSW